MLMSRKPSDGDEEVFDWLSIFHVYVAWLLQSDPHCYELDEIQHLVVLGHYLSSLVRTWPSISLNVFTVVKVRFVWYRGQSSQSMVWRQSDLW